MRRGPVLRLWACVGAIDLAFPRAEGDYPLPALLLMRLQVPRGPEVIPDRFHLLRRDVDDGGGPLGEVPGDHLGVEPIGLVRPLLDGDGKGRWGEDGHAVAFGLQFSIRPEPKAACLVSQLEGNGFAR